EGRGYVLRRILRRALRYGKYIGLNEPFLYDSAGVVVKLMSSAYPELEAHAKLITKVIRNEEERFIDTLARGLVLFEEEASRILGGSGKVLPGEIAFKLYDTYGFPPDVTADLAREAGLVLDQSGFDTEMARQREMARQSWEGMAGEDLAALRKTLEDGVTSEFTGYETHEDSGVVLAIIKDGQRVTEAGPGERVEVVTDRTPFYGESGGQVGDHGIIVSDGNEMEVEDTAKPFPNLIIHKALVKSGVFKEGDRVGLRVNTGLRRSIMANHSATHILQWALRKVLGDHVKQSGSLVEGPRLRFDFTHFSAITPEELARVEELVNEQIQENVAVTTEILPIEEAMKRGATALFGEKYADTVRMVAMGQFSKELCGGTHTRRTGDIGLFKIVSEGGIASGVRRIEAVTGRSALGYVRSLEEEIRAIAERVKGTRGDLVRKLEKLLEEKKNKEREFEALKLKLAGKQTTDLLEGVREINGVKVLSRLIEDISDPKDLRDYADRVKDRIGSGIALLGAKSDGKALLLAVVTKDLTDRFHAGNIVKKAAQMVGGTGGGRPDMAQAGGPKVGDLPQALKSIEEFL
ncbi:MAG: alanine--tRNA ligase, partial [Desulfomonile tiedjei]|nr:alanine--tRNA ligase [Desulfomonile tiedjei]